MRVTFLCSLALLAALLPAQKDEIYQACKEAEGELLRGNGAQAEKLLKAVLEREPKLATVWLRLCMAQQAQGRSAEAGASAEKAAELDPDMVEAKLLAAECWVRIQPAKGVEFAKAVMEKTTDPLYRRRLLDVLVTGHAFELAQPLIEAALKEAPRDLALLKLKIQVAIEQNKPELAIKTLITAIAIDPRDPTMPDSLAQLYFQTGKKDEAVAACEAALKVNPGNLRVRERLISALVEQKADPSYIEGHRKYLAYYQAGAASGKNKVPQMQAPPVPPTRPPAPPPAKQ